MSKYRRVMSHDTEEWFKEKLILEKFAFLCDVIDLSNHGKVLLKCRENLWQLP